jgi:hypothetical protein
MPKRYRWTFVNGGRAQLVDLAGAIGVPKRSQKWCNILLKEKFFLFVINENLGWPYVLAIKTTRSSSHFRRPPKRSRHSIWPPLHQRQQDARLRPAMKALRLVSRPNRCCRGAADRLQVRARSGADGFLLRRWRKTCAPPTIWPLRSGLRRRWRMYARNCGRRRRITRRCRAKGILRRKRHANAGALIAEAELKQNARSRRNRSRECKRPRGTPSGPNEALQR